MQNINVTQKTTSQLSAEKKELNKKLQKKIEEKKLVLTQNVLFLVVIFAL